MNLWSSISGRPSRMEMAGWALLGLLPDAILECLEGSGAGVHVGVSVALGVACGRMSGAWRKGVAAGFLLVVAHTFLLGANDVWRVFYVDPRSLHPITIYFMPLSMGRCTHMTGVLSFGAAGNIWAASVAWCAMASAVAALCFEGKERRAMLVGCLPGVAAFGITLAIHIWVTPSQTILRYTPRQYHAWGPEAELVSFWSLALVYPAYYLALFHDLFAKAPAPRATSPEPIAKSQEPL